MDLQERIQHLDRCGQAFIQQLAEDDALMEMAKAENPWFTKEHILKAARAVVDEYCAKSKVQSWISDYSVSEKESDKVVGLVLAGNIPLVGIHDVICVYLAGHKAQVKLSSKDRILMKAFIKKLSTDDRIACVDRLTDMDAVIATGSNNTSRYFHQYFEQYPHIIRGSRNSVAVLDGSEDQEDIVAIGHDVFDHFGMGCRSVSKIFVPRGYDVTILLELWHEHFKEAVLHNKYKNNFDYYMATLLLGKEKFLNSGSLIIVEHPSIASRIATLHYEYYDDINSVTNRLQQDNEAIQCIVSRHELTDLETVLPGQAQQPSMGDYADGVDTMNFLTTEV